MTTSLSIMLGPPFVSMIICGGLNFMSSRKHLLKTLMSLEFIMWSIFWLFIFFFSSMYEMYLVLFLLTLIACEGALGLALLVSVVRTHGNDQFKAFNFLQF